MTRTINKIIQFVIKHQLLFFFLFVLSFRLFYASQVINFTQDQARDVWLMKSYQDKGQIFIGYGPKVSVGNFHLAPFFYQLHYFVSLLSGHQPLAMAWFITFLESTTPVIFYLILQRFIRKKFALLISLLYALSPLITIFSTFSWNPNLIPLLSLLSLFFAIKLFETNKKKYILFFSLVLSLTVHLHYQSFVLFPFYLYVMVRSLLKDRKNIIYWLFGILFFIILLLPYLFAELSNDFSNTINIIDYFTNHHSQYYDRISKPEFVLTFLPEFFERLVVGKNYVLDKIFIGRFIFWFGSLLLFFKAVKNKKFRIVFLYYFFMILMLRVYKGDKLDYYMMPVFSFPFVLLALIFERLKALFLPILIFIAFVIGSSYQNVNPKNQLSQLIDAMKFVSDYSQSDKVNFHFHDKDLVNVFAYGLFQYSQVKHSPESLTVVDVCYGPQQICMSDGGLWCKHDRGYTHMVLFQEAANYQFRVMNNRNDGYNIVIGEVETLPEINYKVSTYESEYGNDFLLEAN